VILTPLSMPLNIRAKGMTPILPAAVEGGVSGMAKQTIAALMHNHQDSDDGFTSEPSAILSEARSSR